MVQLFRLNYEVIYFGGTITLGRILIGGSFTECLDCMAGWSRFKLRRMQSLNTFILQLLITIPETTVSDPLLRSIQCHWVSFTSRSLQSATTDSSVFSTNLLCYFPVGLARVLAIGLTNILCYFPVVRRDIKTTQQLQKIADAPGCIGWLGACIIIATCIYYSYIHACTCIHACVDSNCNSFRLTRMLLVEMILVRLLQQRRISKERSSDSVQQLFQVSCHSVMSSFSSA